MLSNDVKEYILKAINELKSGNISFSLPKAISNINSAIQLLDNKTKYVVYLYNNALRTDSIDNVFINSYNGEEQSQNGYKVTDFIKIPSGVTKIYFSFNEPSNHLGAFYDENKKFVQGITKGSAGGYSDTSEYWEVKENMKYIRISSGYKTGLYTIYYKTQTSPTNSFIHESDKIYTVDTVQDMKSLNVKTGDVVNTLGYYVANDYGFATYDIISYDEWLYKLNGDVKCYLDASDNNIVKPQKVDEYGNHTLNNGLIAALRKDTTSPEQWGAKGDGITNDVIPFMHMCAQVKTGEIIFGNNKTYLFDIIDDNYETDNPYRTFMAGAMEGGQWYNKPILANIHDLLIDGRNSLIKIADDRFGITGMGVLNLAGDIINVEIKNCRFDCRGCTMTNKNKNSNHTLFYSQGWLNNNDGSKFFHPRLNMDGNFKNPSIKNLNIHNCYFTDNGAMFKTAGDAGGDFILIIDPYQLDGLYIENNEFYNWGRWVFAIDLKGNGERLYNIKFRNNTCIGANAKEGDSYITVVPEGCSDEENWRWRGLGFIDFETRKCFSNVEISGNNVNGSSGFALNGASRISNNFYIHDNVWRHAGGGYPYLIEFYSGEAQNWTFERNTFFGGAMKLGISTNNLYFRNNIVNTTIIRLLGINGDIIFEDNTVNDSNSYHKGIALENNNCPTYINENERNVNFIFNRNQIGITGGSNWNEDFININSFKDNECDWIEFINMRHYDGNFDKFRQVQNQQINFAGLHSTVPLEGISGACYFNEGEEIFSNVKGKVNIITSEFYSSYLDNVKLSEYRNSFNNYLSGNNIDDCKIVCTSSGLIPGNGKYGFANTTTAWDNFGDTFTKLQKGALLYTRDGNVYLNLVEGVPETYPTHTEGIVNNGTCSLLWVDTLGKAKIINL